MQDDQLKQYSKQSQWNDFFSDYRIFDEKRKLQKSQGINDYNLFSSLLKVHDEVRLHSRFIFSLINPSGLHYQGAVFLDKFLSVLGIENVFNLESTEVFIEYNNIDLYCTDGRTHLIIENKIYAKDQKGQIKRYLDIINSDGKINQDDIIVVYLSLGRKTPTEFSLGSDANGYEINTNGNYSYLVSKSDGARKARYINMNYRSSKDKASEIIKWISLCRQAAPNVSNISSALDQYEKIVQRLNKTYKSNIMSLENFLLDDKELSEIRVLQASEIYKSMPAVYANWFNYAMTEGIEELMLPYENNGTLVRMTIANCHTLNEYKYEPSHATLVFSRNSKRKPKNIGVFWAVANGAYKDKIALTMFFGKTHLHIGVVPIVNNGSGQYAFQPNLREAIISVFEHHNNYIQTNAHKLGLISWAKPLIEEVTNLHNFSESQQWKHLKELIEILI